MVYICSPYAGEVERNIRFTQEACHYAISQNCAQVVVHLIYPQLLDDMVLYKFENYRRNTHVHLSR